MNPDQMFTRHRPGWRVFQRGVVRGERPAGRYPLTQEGDPSKVEWIVLLCTDCTGSTESPSLPECRRGASNPVPGAEEDPRSSNKA